MSKEDRFTVIFDEGDWILDQETGEYIDIEQACNKLNDYEDSMGAIGSFVQRKMEEGNKRMIGENRIILGSTELEDKQNNTKEEEVKE